MHALELHVTHMPCLHLQRMEPRSTDGVNLSRLLVTVMLTRTGHDHTGAPMLLWLQCMGVEY